jgi:hypothetical protein
VTFSAGEFYDATIIPERCGFFRNANGKVYLRVGLRDTEGGEHVYAWWVSGKLATRLREALPSMGVDVEAIGNAFYKAAGQYIKAVDCRFVVNEEEYKGTTKLKIGGLFFGGDKRPADEAANDADVDYIKRALFGSSAIDDDTPF